MSDDRTDGQDSKPIPSRGFTKLDSGITKSSVWMSEHDTFRVWIYFLAECDALGVVRASVPAIAHQCFISVERLEAIVALLEAPDPHSRTKSEEGRRLKRIEGGWVVLNYLVYRELTQRKSGSHADRQARFRERLRERNSVTGDAQPSRVTQRQKQKEKQKKKRREGELALPAPLATPEFEAAWVAWVAYRREAGYSAWQATTVRAKLATMAEWGPEKAAAEIRLSIENGWKGIFDHPDWRQRSGKAPAGKANGSNGRAGLEVARRALIDKAFAECAAGRLSEANRDRIDGLATAARSLADLEAIAWE